jgi:hypothetical protein
MCWSFLSHVRFLILLTVFELLPKTCNFTICFIFSNSGHVGWCTASPDTILKLDTLVMIQTKFGFHWSCTFRGEDFWKSLRRTDDDDRRQVMAIAHLTLWVRWAKKGIGISKIYLLCFKGVPGQGTNTKLFWKSVLYHYENLTFEIPPLWFFKSSRGIKKNYNKSLWLDYIEIIWQKQEKKMVIIGPRPVECL